MKLLNLATSLLHERGDKNPNVMPEDEFRRLVLAMKKHGFLQPVLVRDAGADSPGYEVIDGVHRVRAAKECGIDVVPCVEVTSGEDETIALRIGMNRLRGELDLAVVAEQLFDLQQEGWSTEALTVTGYSQQEIEDMLDAAAPDTGDVRAGATSGDDDSDETGDDDKPEPGARLVLEVEMPEGTSKSKLTALKRKLRKAGDGDLGAGLLALVEKAAAAQAAE